ncbi:MAG: hypothetical protein FJ088_16790 [Deltaproteobacteria bacterium]|nr:hypothetical protein [Deltaproteobacteria bacterium]
MSENAFSKDNFTWNEYEELRHREKYAEGTNRLKKAVNDFYEALDYRMQDERDYKKAEWADPEGRYALICNTFFKNLAEVEGLGHYLDKTKNLCVHTFFIDQKGMPNFMNNITGQIKERRAVFMRDVKYTVAYLRFNRRWEKSAIWRAYYRALSRVLKWLGR